MDPCQKEKFARRDRHKDNKPVFKVVRSKGRKSDAGILGSDVDKENFVDVASLSANSLSEMPTWLGTQSNWIALREIKI